MFRPLLLPAFGALAALAVPAAAGDAAHVMLKPEEIVYKPGPASLPAGAEFAILYGDPSSEGLFAMRLKLPEGYHVAPHVHGRPEIVTVISGTFLIGHGETADRAAATELAPGSFFAFAPGMAHFAYATGETVVQVNSSGPWTIDYVDKANDPRIN